MEVYSYPNPSEITTQAKEEKIRKKFSQLPIWRVLISRVGLRLERSFDGLDENGTKIIAKFNQQISKRGMNYVIGVGNHLNNCQRCSALLLVAEYNQLRATAENSAKSTFDSDYAFLSANRHYSKQLKGKI